MKYYLVTYAIEFPAWDEREPTTTRVYASSRSDAINQTRRQVRDNGHLAVSSGRTIIKSAKIDADQEGQ